jgi:hypothetical protein
MKAYFDEHETLVIEASNKFETMALAYFFKQNTIGQGEFNQSIPLSKILCKTETPSINIEQFKHHFKDTI